MFKKANKTTKRLTRGSQPARARAAGGVRYRKGHKKVGGRREGYTKPPDGRDKGRSSTPAAGLGADGQGQGRT